MTGVRAQQMRSPHVSLGEFAGDVRENGHVLGNENGESLAWIDLTTPW